MADELSEKAERRSRRGPRLSPQERRRQIVEAAAKLLSQKGLDAVRIPALAEAVGVTPPVVYRHFFSRDEVFAALAEELGRRNQEVFERAVESLGPNAPASEVWRRAVDLYFDVIRELGPATVRAMLIPTSETGRQRIERWGQWVSKITGISGPLAASILHLSVPMLCSYAELWLEGILSREQAVDLPVKSVLWHIEQLRNAAASREQSGSIGETRKDMSQSDEPI